MKVIAFLLQVYVSCYAAYSVSAAVVSMPRKLTATDGDIENNFGWSVDVSGDVAIVGAWQDDDNGTRSGSAYLYDAANGEQLTKLLPSDGREGGAFGISVAISGDKAVVGARGSLSNNRASGVAYVFDIDTGTELTTLSLDEDARGDWFGWSVDISDNIAIVGSQRDDENGAISGAAYLFDVTTGEQLFKLTPSDAAIADFFGVSVAIDGDTAIVGAYHNRNEPNFGAAYLFDVATGSQLAKLVPNDPGSFDWFGRSVGISDDTAIVGAWRDDDNGSDSGSAYLFDVKTGMQLAKLTPSDGAEEDRFGTSVAIDGNVAIVGANANDSVASDAGSAYLFDVPTGEELAKLSASDGEQTDLFGVSVSIDGGKALVGAYLDDDLGIDSGSAYLFSIVPEPRTMLLAILGAASLMVARIG